MKSYLTLRNVPFQISRFVETIPNVNVYAEVLLGKEHSMFKMLIV